MNEDNCTTTKRGSLCQFRKASSTPQRIRRSSRFRVDEGLKEQAEAVCVRRGTDRNHVLRTLVRRIAIEDEIPFDLNAPARAAEPQRVPFDRYGDFLTQDLAHLEAESLISLLAGFVADRARKIAEEQTKTKPDAAKIAAWHREASEAMQMR